MMRMVGRFALYLFHRVSAGDDDARRGAQRSKEGFGIGVPEIEIGKGLAVDGDGDVIVCCCAELDLRMNACRRQQRQAGCRRESFHLLADDYDSPLAGLS